MRRLRGDGETRAMLRETTIRREALIQPLFVVEGEGVEEPIKSMPGQYRLSVDRLCRECERLASKGIRGVAIFPSMNPDLKSADGKEALNPNGLIPRAVRAVKSAVPNLNLITDIALDPYTDHGHDGVLNAAGTDVANDSTVELLQKMAVLSAESGADWVAPSDMMDFRVGAIREALDQSGWESTRILAYSAKFDSAFYGPFREAVGSAKAAGTPLLSKATYQLDPGNRRQAMLEAELDELEGADVLMVKPAGPYLDIIRDLRDRTHLPIAAYQVSGEYAQIHAAAEKGWLDLERSREESLLGIFRAGADMVLTYFAGQI